MISYVKSIPLFIHHPSTSTSASTIYIHISTIHIHHLHPPSTPTIRIHHPSSIRIHHPSASTIHHPPTSTPHHFHLLYIITNTFKVNIPSIAILTAEYVMYTARRRRRKKRKSPPTLKTTGKTEQC